VSHVSRYLEPAVVEHLNYMQLSARSVVQGSTTGQHKSPIKGASVEFRQHRFYVPGDEPRRLDWRILARTDRPYVKEYDEETNLRCIMVLDRSGSMRYGSQSKFDYAARLLAALAYMMLGQTESVGLAVCGAELEQWVAPHAGPTQLSRLLDVLERTTPQGPSQLAQGLHDVAERLERRALVIVLSDLYEDADGLRGGFAHLRHERHEVLALQVVDRDELEFPFATWTRFRGMENERAHLCEPALMRRAYQDAYARHARALREMSLALRVDLQDVVTDRPLLDALRMLVSRRARTAGV
jgi:uncharacterized protein (DUF58 family)